MKDSEEEKDKRSDPEESDSPCHVFLSEMKTSSPTVFNPLTGKKINKKDKNGKPTALIKKIIKYCE